MKPSRMCHFEFLSLYQLRNHGVVGCAFTTALLAAMPDNAVFITMPVILRFKFYDFAEYWARSYLESIALCYMFLLLYPSCEYGSWSLRCILSYLRRRSRSSLVRGHVEQCVVLAVVLHVEDSGK